LAVEGEGEGGPPGGIDAVQPAPAEAPEMREAAVVGDAAGAVGSEESFGFGLSGGSNREGADLAVDLDTEGRLQEARGTASALVDGAIEVEEGDRVREIRAVGCLPVVDEVDAARGGLVERSQARAHIG
jgi:hypothetical protein